MADLLSFGLSADKTQATVTPKISTPTATAEQIEDAIRELSNLRASMLPSVPLELPLSETRRVVFGARAVMEADTADAGLLLLRNIGQGWLCYRLERSQLLELHRSIETLLARPQMTQQ